jgi:hypothetical protein
VIAGSGTPSTSSQIRYKTVPADPSAGQQKKAARA